MFVLRDQLCHIYICEHMQKYNIKSWFHMDDTIVWHLSTGPVRVSLLLCPTTNRRHEGRRLVQRVTVGVGGHNSGRYLDHLGGTHHPVFTAVFVHESSKSWKEQWIVSVYVQILFDVCKSFSHTGFSKQFNAHCYAVKYCAVFFTLNDSYKFLFFYDHLTIARYCLMTSLWTFGLLSRWL